MKLFFSPALFLMVFVAGCTDTPAVQTVQAAQQHSVNRYELHGSPDKIALLVDSETGNVWRYTQDQGREKFVPVSIATAPLAETSLPSPGTVPYEVRGKTYNIPVADVPEFLKAHPDARKE